MTSSERSRDAASVSRESGPNPTWVGDALGSVGETTIGEGVAPVVVVMPRSGEAFGRYQVLARVGQGAMGTVFAAYDPQLDRRIALKLLGGAGEGAGLAEARALARLSHPNVVAVYDAGTIDGHAFIAMEYIVGRTLAQWLELAPRSGREILAMFLEVGRGLAAAHAAGIVHRDFKPQNVLVGDDARARVVDFGLAHASDAAPSHQGAPAGTPLYMAPELFAGAPASVQSDGFAFGVALWDALYGAPPFDARSVENLVSAMHEALRPPKRRSDVPRHVEEALRRQLLRDPAARFPSTDALLAALAPVRSKAPFVIAGVVALSVAGVWAARERSTSVCEVQWRDDTTQALRSVGGALAAVPTPAAAATSRTAVDALSDFDEAHASAKAEVCRIAAGDPLGAARSGACIDAHRRSADALVELLTTPDVTVAMAVPSLVAALGDPVSCLDPLVAAREAPSNLDPLTLARAEPIRRALADALTFAKAGRPAAGEARLAEIASDVDALDDPAVRGETALVRATVLTDLDRLDEAIVAWYDSIAWATEAGDRLTAARGWIELIYVEGHLRENVEGANLAIRMSEAELAAMPPDPTLAARRLGRLGVALFSRGEIELASTTLRDAVDQLRSLGLELEAATVLMNLAGIESVAGGHTDAESWIAEVAAIWAATLPEGHPDFSRIPEARSQIAELQGDTAARVRYLEEAHRMRAAAIGDTHHESIVLEVLLAESLLQQGDDEGATRWSVLAAEHARGSEHAGVRLSTARGMAQTLHHIGRNEEAARWIDEAMTIATSELPEDSPQFVSLLETRADVSTARGDHAAALADYQRVLVTVQSLWGPKHPFAAQSHGDITQAFFGLGRLEEARRALQAAREVIATMDDVAPAQRLDAYVEIAQASWLMGEAERADVEAQHALQFAAEYGIADVEAVAAANDLRADIARTR